MPWIDVEQNTLAWLKLRSGKVTGSAIAKIMANNGKAFGEPAKKLAVDMAIARITGRVTEAGYSNGHMERGHEQEPMARSLYEEKYFCDIANGGFYDNGLTGCSPDGIFQDGIIEIKSVIASTQYATIKRDGVDPAYKWQIAFNLKESGKDWLDYISYCSEFPQGKELFVKRIFFSNLKEEFEAIDSRLVEFESLVNEISGNISDFKLKGEL